MKKIIILLCLICKYSHGQDKLYQIVSAPINVGNILNINCIIDQSDSISLTKILIRSYDDKYVSEVSKYRLEDKCQSVLSKVKYKNEVAQSLFESSSGKIYFETIDKFTNYHAPVEILILKINTIIIVGYSINRSDLILSLKDIFNDFFEVEIINCW